MSSYIPIASQTLGSSAASVTFSSIPTTLNGKTLRDLIIVGRFESAGNNTLCRINSDTGNNYNHVLMYAAPSAGSFTQSSVDRFVLDFGASMLIMQVFDFAQTNKHKSILSRSDNASSATGAAACRWANTSAVTSIQLYVGGTFAAGSTFSLYGLEG
jgi:hypothetical protein